MLDESFMVSGTGASTEKPDASCSTNLMTLEGKTDLEQAAMVTRDDDAPPVDAFDCCVKITRVEQIAS